MLQLLGIRIGLGQKSQLELVAFVCIFILKKSSFQAE